MSTILHAAFAARYPAAEAQALRYDEADRIADHALRRRADKADPPPVLSRAEQIVAEGHAKRAIFGRVNPGADTVMVYGVQIGYLHGQVQRLCAELERYQVTRTPGLEYREIETDIGAVLVGYTYLPELVGDEPGLGFPAAAEVVEVWCNGVDLHAWVPGDELDRIGDLVLEQHEEALRREAEHGATRAEVA